MSVLKALSDMNRLRIMRFLLKNRLGVNTIAQRLRISEYNVSKHLRILKEVDLLEMEKAGKQRLYGVAPRLKDHLGRQSKRAGTGLLHVPVRQAAEIALRKGK
jgi:DNA-binding transcriptional ArsR family regulator